MEQVAENVYVETGYEGVNVAAVITPNGVVAIDTPSYARQARDWSMRLNALHPRSVQYIILTDYHGDRIVNTRWLNAPIIAHETTAEKLNSYDKRYPATILESLSARNPDRGRELSNGPVEKPAITFTENMRLGQADYEMQIVSAPGPTGGSAWVYLPHSHLLIAGDLLTTSQPPLLKEANSHAWLQALETLQQFEQPIDKILPGRGQLCQQTEIYPVYEYIESMIRCMQGHLAAGKPREETAVYIAEFMNRFPNHTLPSDWVRRQIKLSLDRVYDEIQLAKPNLALPNTPASTGP